MATEPDTAPAAPRATPLAMLGRDDGLIPELATAADPVVIDPRADWQRSMARPDADDLERTVVSVQLGRPARGRSAVVHRCVYGLPTVIRVEPRLPDGTPFPTLFWQTCPALRSQIGRLEADRSMVGINQRLDEDAEFAGAHADAQHRYRDRRDELGGPLPGNPFAGGSPRYVKCLHTHAGHALATNDSPVGAETMEAARPVPCAGPCVTPEDIAGLVIADPAREQADPTTSTHTGTTPASKHA